MLLATCNYCTNELLQKNKMTDANSLHLSIEYHSGIPVYKQIIQAITAAVESGGLQTGDRLPTIRDLSRLLKVNPNTVAKAYREMELTQLLETNGRNGSQINDKRQSQGRIPVSEKKKKLDQIYATALAEARASQISEADLRQRFAEGSQNSGENNV